MFYVRSSLQKKTWFKRKAKKIGFNIGLGGRSKPTTCSASPEKDYKGDRSLSRFTSRAERAQSVGEDERRKKKITLSG